MININLLDKIRHTKTLVYERWDHVMTISIVVFLLALVMPSPPIALSNNQTAPDWVHWVENQGRFTNTILQVALPVITRDLVSLKALAWVALTGTAATHGLKHSMNLVEINGVRLGQRPSNENSRHNFPSGHSSMASSGAVFVAVRFGWYWLLLLLPITFATMYARIVLDAHTLTAVIAGAALGVFFTWPFCRKNLAR